MNYTVPAFISGIHNLIDPENIPKDAAQDAQNFLTQDGRTVLVGGRELFGAAGTVGGTTGFHKGYKVNGSTVIYAKRGTAIQYWDGSAWQDSITGLSATDEYTFANYSSLAGAFTYVNGPGAYYKIINSHPGSPVSVYSSTKNFYGYIKIDKGRTILWNRAQDKTGLYGSWIDRQDATVYTTVTAEAIGALGSTTYSGTLAFKGGGATRTCFGVSFTATVAAGAETFTDNYLGVLTSNRGGTGTINYATGAYSVTFSAVTTGSVTSDYQWEDSNDNGITDFTKSSTRVAGEGFQVPQDEGGDPILSVEFGADGAYYSLKQNSCYRLAIAEDDLSIDNQVFMRQMGMSYFRSSVSTDRGILFVNTFNPTKPEITILQQNTVSLTLVPKVLFKHFKFSNYAYDRTFIGSFDRWAIVFCRTADSATNNRMLMCDVEKNTVDVVAYSGNMSIQDDESLYVADSVTTSVYKVFSGFDDLQSPVDAYWIGKYEFLGTDKLKKTRRFRFKGYIDPDQSVKVYMNPDSQGWTQVGTIVGSASYVSVDASQAIGGRVVGSGLIGGDGTDDAFAYHMEMRAKTGKYRTLAIKFEPEGYGYFDFDTITYWDNLLFEDRLPSQYRQKQDVSLDGTETDQ